MLAPKLWKGAFGVQWPRGVHLESEASCLWLFGTSLQYMSRWLHCMVLLQAIMDALINFFTTQTPPQISMYDCVADRELHLR